MFKKLTWASVDSLKKSFTEGSTVVYDNEIQILGGSTNTTQWYRRNRRLYNKQAILPSGVAIRIANIIPDSITTVSNCTKRPDGSILVDSDGMVEFYLAYNNTINYSIF